MRALFFSLALISQIGSALACDAPDVMTLEDWRSADSVAVVRISGYTLDAETGIGRIEFDAGYAMIGELPEPVVSWADLYPAPEVWPFGRNVILGLVDLSKPGSDQPLALDAADIPTRWAVLHIACNEVPFILPDHPVVRELVTSVFQEDAR